MNPKRLNPLLHIDNLSVRPRTGDALIVKGVSLEVMPGSHHALMGSNGSGKSTLAESLAGNPAYEIAGGSVTFRDQNLLALAPEERARLGLHVVTQHPPVIPGVTIARFLHLAVNAHRTARNEEPLSFSSFIQTLKPAMARVRLPWDTAGRGLHEGFSGGERKRLELLQLLVLQPVLAILDEIDSGMDMDAVGLVVETVEFLREKNPEAAFITISHYRELLERLKPDCVHIFKDGAIRKSGPASLLGELTTLQ